MSDRDENDLWPIVDSSPSFTSYSYGGRDGWSELRNGRCVALRSDGYRCNGLTAELAGFCAFHFRRLQEFFTERGAERELRRAELADPSAFRWMIDAALVDDAKRVLEAESTQVYFIAVDDIVKIGYSKHPLRRYHTIRQGGSCKVPEGYSTKESVLLGAIDGSQALEHSLHHMLGDHRIDGEWFVLSPLVVELIEHLLYDGPVPKEIEAALRALFTNGRAA